MRYVKKLTEQEVTLLETHYKTSSHHRERERCKALLLSNQGTNIKALAAHFGLDRDTIHHWVKRWERPPADGQGPLDRLRDAPRSGRPGLLSPDQKKA